VSCNSHILSYHEILSKEDPALLLLRTKEEGEPDYGACHYLEKALNPDKWASQPPTKVVDCSRVRFNNLFRCYHSSTNLEPTVPTLKSIVEFDAESVTIFWNAGYNLVTTLFGSISE